MPLHLVGETLDRARSHYRAEAGQLVQLMRGVYADAADDADAIVLGHAVRIAKYLYPRAYLSSASAVLVGPTRDGRLFLSGRRNKRTRLRSLEIVQNEAPSHPSLVSAAITDPMGEFRIDVSSPRQRFLEAFRLRSEHASAIDDAMRDAMAARLIEEYSTPRAAADAVWALARENTWLREAEQAERWLIREPRAAAAPSAAALDLIVAWHGVPIGHLLHDGFEWRWHPEEGAGPPIVRQAAPGKLPPFIVSLLPEGWLERVLHDRDERAMLRAGKRYMSNIMIVERSSELLGLPADVLQARLESFSSAGIFTGRYAGPGRGAIEQTFEENLARLYQRAETPRLSGVQVKAPMFLDRDGLLRPSTDSPFTHILKPAGTGGFGPLPLVEYLCLELARTAGFIAPPAALVPMPDGMPPALVVERFDIRQDVTDRRLIAMEDFCSLLGLPTSAKYDGTIEQAARSLRPVSTDPDADLLLLLERALFAWLIADGDMHLKNLALLKIAEPGDERFRSVRLAPAYDAVTTWVFPGLAGDRMALKLNGKDDRLARRDFRTAARTISLTAAAADAAIDKMATALDAGARRLILPTLPDYGPDGETTARRMLALCQERAAKFK